MNKIYCVYCGSKNDSKSINCAKCGKSLNPKEHLFKDYLHNHIKDDLKDKVKDNFLSLITNFIKSHLYGAILSLAVIFGATAGIVNVINKPEVKKVKENNNIIKTINLDINSELVTNIYKINAINKELETNEDFYQNKKVTFEDLSEKAKFDLAYRFIERDKGSAKRNTSTCDFLKGYSLYEGCLKDSEYYLDFAYFGYNKKDLEESYHKIFGSNASLPLGHFYVSEVQECEYSKENDDYLCYMGMVGGYWVPERVTKIIKAEEHGNTITIYDKYILLSEEGTYKDPEEKEILDKEWNENLVEKGNIYKHIYQKDINNNYYWISSEPVK